MKKVLLSLCLLALLSLACAIAGSGTVAQFSGTPTPSVAQPSSTPTDVPLERCVVAADYLYIRAAPGKEHTVVGYLRGGTVAHIHLEMMGWYYIEGDAPGWISSAYCDLLPRE